MQLCHRPANAHEQAGPRGRFLRPSLDPESLGRAKARGFMKLMCDMFTRIDNPMPPKSTNAPDPNGDASDGRRRQPRTFISGGGSYPALVTCTSTKRLKRPHFASLLNIFSSSNCAEHP